MFRSTTIIRELVLNLAKVIFMLKHSVKLRRYTLFYRMFQRKYNFIQVQYKLPDDGRRPKHVGAIIFTVAPCILKSILFTQQQMQYLLNLERFKILQ
jgi:hypothetical protein